MGQPPVFGVSSGGGRVKRLRVVTRKPAGSSRRAGRVLCGLCPGRLNKTGVLPSPRVGPGIRPARPLWLPQGACYNHTSGQGSPSSWNPSKTPLTLRTLSPTSSDKASHGLVRWPATQSLNAFNMANSSNTPYVPLVCSVPATRSLHMSSPLPARSCPTSTPLHRVNTHPSFRSQPKQHLL